MADVPGQVPGCARHAGAQEDPSVFPHQPPAKAVFKADPQPDQEEQDRHDRRALRRPHLARLRRPVHRAGGDDGGQFLFAFGNRTGATRLPRPPRRARRSTTGGPKEVRFCLGQGPPASSSQAIARTHLARDGVGLWATDPVPTTAAAASANRLRLVAKHTFAQAQQNRWAIRLTTLDRQHSSALLPELVEETRLGRVIGPCRAPHFWTMRTSALHHIKGMDVFSGASARRHLCGRLIPHHPDGRAWGHETPQGRGLAPLSPQFHAKGSGCAHSPFRGRLRRRRCPDPDGEIRLRPQVVRTRLTQRLSPVASETAVSLRHFPGHGRGQHALVPSRYVFWSGGVRVEL